MKVALLAVGTEVTDGQVLDRNSNWLAARLVDLNFQVTEHSVIPDERKAIAARLEFMMAANDLVVVTGGLGPTSDDFTREVICNVVGQHLELNHAAFERVKEKLNARQVPVRESHKQQCFFPKDALIFENPVGTADAFLVERSGSNRGCKVLALPGPPVEINGIWQDSLKAWLEKEFKAHDPEKLFIWRTLGLGESEIAHKVEEIIVGSDLRVGYRAHVPYVDVKLWLTQSQRDRFLNLLAKLDEILAPWLLQKSDEELTGQIWRELRGRKLILIDEICSGLVAEKFSVCSREYTWPLGFSVVSGGEFSGSIETESFFARLYSEADEFKLQIGTAGSSTEKLLPVSARTRGSIERRRQTLAEHFLREVLEFLKKS